MNKLCGAKSRQNKNQSCRRYAMINGRCHLHGGKSTGSKTIEGKIKQKMASWKHGMRSKEAIEETRAIRQLMHKYRNAIGNLSI